MLPQMGKAFLDAREPLQTLPLRYFISHLTGLQWISAEIQNRIARYASASSSENE